MPRAKTTRRNSGSGNGKGKGKRVWEPNEGEASTSYSANLGPPGTSSFELSYPAPGPPAIQFLPPTIIPESPNAVWQPPQANPFLPPDAVADASVHDTFIPFPNYHGQVSRDPNFTISFESATSLQHATPLTECLAGVGLREPHTPMFVNYAQAGCSTVPFSLIWPGYPNIDWVVDIPLFGRKGLLTRRELAFILATQYREFVRLNDENHLYGTDSLWRVGGLGGWRFEDMKLWALTNVAGPNWQCMIRVPQRH